LSSGVIARDGYKAVAEFDVKGDGMITAADPKFKRLIVWVNKGHTAESAAMELQSVSDLGISALSVRAKESSKRDRFGNRFEFRAKVSYLDGHEKYSYDAGPSKTDCLRWANEDIGLIRRHRESGNLTAGPSWRRRPRRARVSVRQCLRSSAGTSRNASQCSAPPRHPDVLARLRLWIHVNRLHEPARLVCANRQEREIDRTQPPTDVAEKIGIGSVAGEIDADISRQHGEPAPDLPSES
jgi:hypothetical protein